MTEAGWLACNHWRKMLWFLEERMSDRKSRLFLCACCRMLWNQVPKNSQLAIEVAERFADGLATAGELEEASYRADGSAISEDLLHQQLRAEANGPPLDVEEQQALYRQLALQSKRLSLADTAHAATFRDFDWEHLVEASGVNTEWPFLVPLVRELVGNPFHPTLPLPARVLAWSDRTIPRIAQGIYNDRAFDRVPILHDALLDAGCDDEAILSHCRGAGPHVRGCWVIDLILGKE